MNRVMTSYDINQQTLALLPAREIDYDTIVIEGEDIKHVRQTALNIIKDACLKRDWTTYESRREAVIHHTNFVQKTPIPIDIQRGIYFFPTHSPSHPDNIWIAFHQVLSIKKVPTLGKKKQVQSIVHFKNGHTLKLSISHHTLQTQFERTFECMYRIEQAKENANIIYPW